MAKLTLSFKGRLLAAYRLEGAVSLVGRDPACDIVIDSLAVADRHVQITETEEALTLTALDAEHPVYRNGQRIDRAALADGDLILVGKHTLSVSLSDDDAPLLSRPGIAAGTGREHQAGARDAAPAYLQIQNGPQIGQIIPVTRAVTRLQRIGGDEVIITRRGEAYVLSLMGEANRVDVGRQSLRADAEAVLRNGEQIEVDGVRCQFFCPVTGEDGDIGAVAVVSPDDPAISNDPAVRPS